MATAPTAEPKLRRLARSVFISYSRKDGTDAAQNLRDELKAAGCEVWLDTERIRGGASWTKEIEGALNRCDVLLAVLTPASFISEICRAEQIWALDEGKVVIPVLAVAGAQVPLYLKGRNWRKYPEHKPELLEDLALAPGSEAPKERPLRYDTIPNLPHKYLIREAALAQLRDLVFTEGADSSIAVTALAGMGGVGKTVLATALCRDPVVQRAFPDGIAWITIGREWDGDFVTRMREMARALGDDLSGYDNPLACENRYRTTLRENAALVVVDDIWNLEHLKPLLVDAPRSRFLFTTRDAAIAKAVTDRKFSANVLNENEALSLLARWAGKTEKTLPSEAKRIIQECGHLAAAVAQIGASLGDLSPTEWCDTLQALESADISAIEDRLPTGQRSFFKSLAVSFQALTEQMQRRYLSLAVLLEDVPAPAVVLQMLWKVNEAEARRTARYFVDRSLALWEDEADLSRGIRLHDLQMDYVRAQYPDRDALDLIHGALRLSSNALARDPPQFASQLVGRLLPYANKRAIQQFTEELVKGAPAPWLRPLWPGLSARDTGLLRTLEGHSDCVNAVAISPDGRRAVSASRDHTLRVWDLETGRQMHIMEGHSRPVNGIAIAPDAERAVSVAHDNTVKVWDLKTGRELCTMEGHSGPVNGIAITPDGRRAVSASADKTLKVWDLETGREVRTLEGHWGSVESVAVTADGRRAVSGSYDHTVKVWDLETGCELRTLKGHSDGVLALAVSPDGRRAVSACYGRMTLKVWDLESGRQLRTLEGHSGLIRAVAVNRCGQRAVSASWDKTLKVWDVETGRELRTLEGHSGSINGVAVSPDGQRAVSASDDRTLKVWDLETGGTLRTLQGHSRAVLSVGVSRGTRRAVSASSDKMLKVWDLETGRELRTLEGHSDTVIGVAVSPDGRRAVSACCDNTLKLWDLETGHELRTLQGHSKYVHGVALSPDGRRLVSASWHETLKVLDLETGRELRTLEGYSPRVKAMGVSPDGRRLAFVSWAETLNVWDLESGRELRTLEGHSHGVIDLAVSSDGRRVVSACYDGTLKLWDLETGRELRTLGGHTSLVNRVAVSPEGQRAASASDDKTLKVWDLSSGSCIATFTCDAPALCCTFTDNRTVLAGDAIGRLHLLRLETGSEQ